MSEEREDRVPALLAKKLLAREKLTAGERDLLTSSDAIMSAVLRELAPPVGSKNGYPDTSPNGASQTKPERETAEQSLAHGKAVVAREFPDLSGSLFSPME